MKTSKFFEFGFATKRDLQELSEAIKNAETIDGEVSTYADLPAPANHNGEIWLVKTTTGVVFVNKKVAGLYVSNGTTWAIITPVEIDGYQKLITTPTDGNIVITDANGQTKDSNQNFNNFLLKSQNLDDLNNKQTALNIISNVANTTNEYVLTKDTATGNAIFKPSAGGSFNPTITSVQDGQFIKYDAFQNLWVNQHGSIDRPTIAVTGYTVSLTSSLKTQFNLGTVDGVQYKLYSNAGLTNLVYDTGVLSAGANFDFANYTTAGTTYYVIGRIRENKYNIFSSYSQSVSFLRQASTVLNNVGIYCRQVTDAPANADNPNTYNPSTAWYSYNGSTWTVAQRVAISNNLGSTMGTQTIANGTTYTFNNGIIDGLGSANTATHTLVADLGVAKNITQIYWNSMAGNTPGGWGSSSYTNGVLFEYWNGSAWTAISSTPANPLSGYPNTSGSGVNSVILTFASINARYFRVRSSTNFASATRFQMFGS